MLRGVDLLDSTVLLVRLLISTSLFRAKRMCFADELDIIVFLGSETQIFYSQVPTIPRDLCVWMA